jgi:hypothetical protein
MTHAGWYLLIHQLPPKPLYLRAKVRQRLARVGALALKNSVYVLPRRGDCLEDFEWIAQEAVAGGGDAWVSQGSFLAGVTNEELVKRFQDERRADYQSLSAEIEQALAALKHRSGSRPPESEIASKVERLKKRLAEIQEIDFFPAASGKTAAAALNRLERAARPQKRPPGGPPVRHADLLGKTWITRPGIKVDRIATAWLVRRFIDPHARFRFADPKTAAPGEIRFDTMPGDVTHEGDRCTFETLVARAGITDPAIREIAEIVHDVDLKDGKFTRADAAGVQRLVAGLILAHPEDEARLSRGFALFDDLHSSFAQAAGAGGAPPGKKPFKGGPR